MAGHHDLVWSVAFSPDGARLLTGSWDHTAKLWDAATGKLLRTFEGHTDLVSSVALSSDGTHAVSGSEEGTVKVWDVGTSALLHSIDAHQSSVRGVAISPDGTRLASGGEDQTAKVWDATSGALLATFKGHTGDVISVSFSRDGRRLLTGSWDKTAKLWDVGTGSLICTFTGHAGKVASAVFSQDGTRVLTSSWDGTAKLWDTDTAALIRTFTGHTDWIFSAAISPDGTRVATGSRDTTIRIWSVRTGELLALLLAGPDGGWLTMTHKGFYIASPKGAPKLGIVRGLNIYSLAQLPAALKSTELAKTALADDSAGDIPQDPPVPSTSARFWSAASHRRLRAKTSDRWRDRAPDALAHRYRWRHRPQARLAGENRCPSRWRDAGPARARRAQGAGYSHCRAHREGDRDVADRSERIEPRRGLRLQRQRNGGNAAAQPDTGCGTHADRHAAALTFAVDLRRCTSAAHWRPVGKVWFWPFSVIPARAPNRQDLGVKRTCSGHARFFRVLTRSRPCHHLSSDEPTFPFAEITDMLGLHVGSPARPTGLTLAESATVDPVGATRRPTTGVPSLTTTNPVAPDCCGRAAGYCQVAGPGWAGQRS